MNSNRLNAILKKEFMHIMRDPFTLLFALMLPLLIILVLGSAIEFNLKKISTVVIDHDQTTESRKLIETFASSSYFRVHYKNFPDEAFDEIVKEKAKVAIIIPPKFGRALTRVNRSQYQTSVQILIDGADNSAVASIMNYLNTISFLAVAKISNQEVQPAFPITIKERYLFNHELNSKWFAIPGLAAVIIAIVAILLTSLTICKEWENGSMELLMSTPVKSSELILGKTAPYAILASAGFLILYLCARVVFKVPMVGSHLILFGTTLLFIINYLGIGLYISVTTKIQQLAAQKAMIIGLLPTTMLSGFIFPIEYMPNLLRYLTYIFPARWYVEVARHEFLKGNTFADLLLPCSILLVHSVSVIMLSILKFKRNLE